MSAASIPLESASRVGAFLAVLHRDLYVTGKELPAFLAQSNLNPVSIEKVNFPRIWSLVTCVKES